MKAWKHTKKIESICSLYFRMWCEAWMPIKICCNSIVMPYSAWIVHINYIRWHQLMSKKKNWKKTMLVVAAHNREWNFSWNQNEKHKYYDGENAKVLSFKWISVFVSFYLQCRFYMVFHLQCNLHGSLHWTANSEIQKSNKTLMKTETPKR